MAMLFHPVDHPVFKTFVKRVIRHLPFTKKRAHLLVNARYNEVENVYEVQCDKRGSILEVPEHVFKTLYGEL